MTCSLNNSPSSYTQSNTFSTSRKIVAVCIFLLKLEIIQSIKLTNYSVDECPSRKAYRLLRILFEQWKWSFSKITRLYYLKTEKSNIIGR